MTVTLYKPKVMEFETPDIMYRQVCDPDSKQKIISSSLSITDDTAGNYFFDTNLEIDKAVQNYNQILDTLDGVFFDQGLMSLGTNGTIAAIFGGEEQLKHQSEYAIATKSNESLDQPDRLSLTVEALLNSESLYIILTGESKRQVLLELVEGNLPATQYPAKVILTHPNVTIFCCFD